MTNPAATGAALLTTKLFPPPEAPTQILRADVMTQLNTLLEPSAALALIAAPAGFGKSSLAAAWCRAQNVATAWLSLDAADNDPPRFLDYLLAAFRNHLSDPHALDDLAVLAQSPQSEPLPALVTLLLSRLHESLAALTVLVLDDYHFMEHPLIHEAVKQLVEYHPPLLRVILTTRADPPLPLARWRARGSLYQVRQTDLQFDRAETAAFLNERMGLGLTPTQIAALNTRTEGWIAGLQLAALSMRGQHDKAQFIASFTGSHRFVLDYLMEEVLQQQNATTLEFLRDTCILERFNRALCDAVRDDRAPSSDVILKDLERANLFLIPLDETRAWYRYHQLFADVLRNRLEQTDAARLNRLHRCASEWFAQHGFANEALGHALAARDFARSAELLTAHLDEWLKRGEYVSLGAWLDALPAGFLTAQPRLGLARTATLISAHQLDAAERLLDTLDTPPSDALYGEILAQRAALAHFRNHPARTIELANEALAALPPNLTRVRTETRFYLGLAYGMTDQLVPMQETMRQVARDSRATGDWYHALYADFQLGALYFALGQLQRAIATCREAIAFADAQRAAELMVVGWLYSELGGALYEANELTEAAEMLERAMGYAQRGAMPRMQVVVLMRQIESARSARDQTKRARLLAQAEALIRDYQLPPRYSGIIQARRVEWWLETAQLASARAWAREFQTTLGDVIDYVREDECAALARVRLAEGDPDAALEILDRLCANTTTMQRRGSAILFQTLRACALSARGENQRALDLLSEQLTWSAAEKYIRVFVDEGAKVETLLRSLHAKWRSAPQRPAYFTHLETILAAFPRPAVTESPAPSLSPKPAALIEPLTPREKQMLELIAQGYTDREIAARLHISSATVKKHLANLFGKLDVHSRTQALARARASGLL